MMRSNYVGGGGALSLFMVIALQGCGGGGGDGGNGAAFFPEAGGAPITSTPAPPSSPATGPEPEPEPMPAPAPAPAPALDPNACLNAPQAGSMADVGNPFEGVYKQIQPNYLNGLMLVDGSGGVDGFAVTPQAFFSVLLNGSLEFDVPNASWSVASGTANSTTIAQPWAGSGQFVPKSTISGSFSVGSAAPSEFGPWTYDIANSLALSPSALEGKWGGKLSFIDGAVNIAADGSLTGSSPATSIFGTCTYSGSVRLKDPTTAKNSLAVVFSAANAAVSGEPNCLLERATHGTGFVHLNQRTVDGVCKASRSLYLFLRGASGEPIGTIGFPG